MEAEIKELIEQANQVYKENFSNKCNFSRAVFLSWYCSLGDCTFCYMSTQKDKIKEPGKAKRKKGSVIAELLITKKAGFEIEFLSAGYGVFNNSELLEVIKLYSNTINEKLWLNIGYLNENEIKLFFPYIKGISLSIETINSALRKKVCPSKPLEPMLKTLELAKKYNLKKSITIIIGIGETINDFENLSSFIKEYEINQVTFYSLNPHLGTSFKVSPPTEYYLEWIAKTRIKFPKINIIAGSWINRIEEFPLLLKAGANNFTKLPLLKMFGTKEAHKIEKDIKEMGRELQGTITTLPNLNWNKEIESIGLDKKLEEEVKEKLNLYLKRIRSNIKIYENNINQHTQNR